MSLWQLMQRHVPFITGRTSAHTSCLNVMFKSFKVTSWVRLIGFMPCLTFSVRLSYDVYNFSTVWPHTCAELAIRVFLIGSCPWQLIQSSSIILDVFIILWIYSIHFTLRCTWCEEWAEEKLGKPEKNWDHFKTVYCVIRLIISSEILLPKFMYIIKFMPFIQIVEQSAMCPLSGDYCVWVND